MTTEEATIDVPAAQERVAAILGGRQAQPSPLRQQRSHKPLRRERNALTQAFRRSHQQTRMRLCCD